MICWPSMPKHRAPKGPRSRNNPIADKPRLQEFPCRILALSACAFIRDRRSRRDVGSQARSVPRRWTQANARLGGVCQELAADKCAGRTSPSRQPARKPAGAGHSDARSHQPDFERQPQVTWAHAMGFLRATIAARLALRLRPIEEVVSRVARRASQASGLRVGLHQRPRKEPAHSWSAAGLRSRT